MNWAVTVGAMMAVAVASLGRLGGVRIDAEAGLCEPGDASRAMSVGRITVVAEDGKVTRARGLPFPDTCHREVGGLAPGRYLVQVTPPRAVLPPYTVSFEVRPSEWTAVPLLLPPVIVRGRVTSNGIPVPNAVPGFAPSPRADVKIPSRGQEPSAFGQAATDDDGHYSMVLWAPGSYTQSFRLNGQELSGAQRDITFGSGVNLHDVEVGAGGLRIWFTERGATLQEEITVRLTLHALPQKPFDRVIRAGSTAVDVGMLAPGNYIVRATAERRSADGGVVSLVSAREAEMKVSPNLPTDVSIDLVSREGWLGVFDPEGRPVEGASVVSYPGAASLRTDEAGRVSLATLPVGARVPIRTRTWGMTCHVVTEDLVQRVTIADASQVILLRVPQGPVAVRPSGPDATRARQELAGSTVSGLSGATCPLPFEAFSVAESRVPGAVEFTLMLPAGTYTLTLRDGRTFSFRAPSAVEITK